MSKLNQCIEHAQMWVKRGKEHRRMSYQLERPWHDPKKLSHSIFCYDSKVGMGTTLPKDFLGDINKLLCESRQNELQGEIDDLQKKLDNMQTNGCK